MGGFVFAAMVSLTALAQTATGVTTTTAHMTLSVRDVSSVQLELDGERVETHNLMYLMTFSRVPGSLRLRQWHAWSAHVTDAEGHVVSVGGAADFTDPAWVDVPLVGLTAPLTLIVEREE